MSSTWGQSAWILSRGIWTSSTNRKNPSETQRNAFSSGNVNDSTKFKEWLVGVTDGDGTFYFAKTKKDI